MADVEVTKEQNAQSDALKFAIPERGYGTYLIGVLPEDQRVLAGAFSVSMRQIKNIEQIQLDKFAQAAYGTENMFGLNLVNGTDVPTDVRLARIAQGVCALGGGVYGTYTMSNFFGAMSGLCYPLREIYNGIKQLETEKLTKTYQQLFLATTWEQAETTVGVSLNAVSVPVPPGDPPLYNWTYTITTVVLDNPGGGYGRGDAPLPVGTFGDNGTGYFSGTGGASVTFEIGTNPDEVPTNYGRIIKFIPIAGTAVTYATNQTSSVPDDPGLVFHIQAPPIGIYSYPFTGGSNEPYGTVGWQDPMNSVVQDLIDKSNNEIFDISIASPTNFDAANILNTNWIITGKALKQEQRARFISSAPVPVPWDRWLANYPTSMYIFVDALPDLAGNTLPHMYAQTLENISDLDLCGGQSVVGIMRESRNEERLNNAGLVLDNNLANDLDDESKEQLITNGVLPNAPDGINGYTIPVFPGEDPNGELTAVPIPVSYYDPCTGGLMCYNEIVYVENNPTAAILAAPDGLPEEVPFEELPATPEGFEPFPQPEIQPLNSDTVVPDTSFPCEGTYVELINGVQPSPVTTTVIGAGAAVMCDPPVDYPIGVNQPPIIIKPELDTELTSSTLSPSAPTVQQAIDQVIKCNCDCWVV